MTCNEELAARIKAGTDAQGNMLRLWQQTKGFIHVVAASYQGFADIEDLEQEGFLALYDAVEGFCPERGCKFLTYAEHWMRRRMMQHIQNNKAVRIPANKQWDILRYKKLARAFLASMDREPTPCEVMAFMGLTRKQASDLERAAGMGGTRSIDEPVFGGEDETALQELLPSGGSLEDDAVARLDYEEMKSALWKCVDGLEGEQPRIIRLIYKSGMNRGEAGKEIGMDGNAVRRQEKKALWSLRQERNASRIRPYYEEYIQARAYGGGTEWDSVTERVALSLLEKYESAD